MAPLVSVVLPVFNASATIARAVETIRSQTLRDWEIIIVNDGSSDSTPLILNELARAEPRLRLLSRTHTGIVSALNAGLELARGRFIARMDADDEAHPDRLAEQAKLLETQPQLGLASSLVAFHGDRERAEGYALHVDWMNGLISPEEIELNRFVESPLAHPSVLFRRELLTQYGGYRSGEFPEDYELWLRWLDHGVKMAKVPKFLLTWHDSANRLSRCDRRYDLDAFYRCKAIYLARWLGRYVGPERRLLIWGAGRPTRKRADYLRAEGVRIDGYIDIDPRKIGRRLSDNPVIGPEQLPGKEEVFVLGYVAKRGARELARAHMVSRGFRDGFDFLMAA
jgi:glycosyltransferase involved in cell wall biosynthesis